MEVAKVLIGFTEHGSSVENRVLQCMSEIIADIRKDNPDFDFSDNTYRELYLLCQGFAKQTEDLLSTDSATDNSSIFGTAINYNYFSQRRNF